ncbi:MAG: DUF4382 domain-containing protein [Gammaproteobacteria bacterium]|nr:DUF4382 domain-containing protein [Gammaproteobacteria bacterium]
MNRISIPAARLLCAIALASLLSACGGGGGGGGNNSSGLSLSITDAPVDDANIAEVWVRFTEVIIHPADGSADIVHSVEDNSDPNNITPYRDIELKALVGGKTSLLGTIPLDAGDYNWVRLVIDPDYTRVVETGGGSYLVKCPSCTQSGFKLNRPFTIDTTGWIDFVIDFDLRKSLTLSQPNKPRADFQYILRPTLRILDTKLASSTINGIVTDLRSEPVAPAAADACWVYVYPGDANSIVPDDICLDPDTSICPAADRPLLETPVTFDTVSGDYIYNTGFIYPGQYTVALLCEADDPDVDEGLLLFMNETSVQADAVSGGVQQDLALQDVPILSIAKTLDGNADEDASTTVTLDDTLTYRMLLSNNGNVTLTDVDVTDPLPGLGALTCNAALPASLAPGTTLDCTADYVVQAADTTILNTATATSGQTGPVTDSASVDVIVP